MKKRKQYQIPLNNWETCKQEIKEASISYSNLKSKQRKANLKIGKEMLNNGYINNEEISSRIQNKREEIKNFQTKGNIVRTKNEALNRIYEEGKEVNRKTEIKKGAAKFIFQIVNEEETFSKVIYFTKYNRKSNTRLLRRFQSPPPPPPQN